MAVLEDEYLVCSTVAGNEKLYYAMQSVYLLLRE